MKADSYIQFTQAPEHLEGYGGKHLTVNPNATMYYVLTPMRAVGIHAAAHTTVIICTINAYNYLDIQLHYCFLQLIGYAIYNHN